MTLPAMPSQKRLCSSRGKAACISGPMPQLAGEPGTGIVPVALACDQPYAEYAARTPSCTRELAATIALPSAVHWGTSTAVSPIWGNAFGAIVVFVSDPSRLIVPAFWGVCPSHGMGRTAGTYAL